MNVIYPDRLFQRRLSDKLLLAFDQACAIGELTVAHEILCSLEGLFSRPSRYLDQDRRQNLESLVEAHERLWTLRRRKAGQHAAAVQPEPALLTFGPPDY